jgi:hypothetical protein
MEAVGFIVQGKPDLLRLHVKNPDPEEQATEKCRMCASEQGISVRSYD